MLRGARVAVVVPAYREARLIQRTLRSVPSFVDHVVVVDDASDDDTGARARGVGDPRVEVVRHEDNRGVGAAIATGYRVAFAAGADVAAVMAGDAQMDPADLAGLLDPVLSGAADYAKGDRLAFPGASQRMPRARWLGNHALSWLTRLATGVEVRDSQCGYTALGRRAAAAIALDGLWPRYGYPNDLLGHLAAARLRVHDVCVRPIYGDEQSGIGWRHALVVVPWVLLRVAGRRLRARLMGAPAAERLLPAGSRAALDDAE